MASAASAAQPTAKAERGRGDEERGPAGRRPRVGSQPEPGEGEERQGDGHQEDRELSGRRRDAEDPHEGRLDHGEDRGVVADAHRREVAVVAGRVAEEIRKRRRRLAQQVEHEDAVHQVVKGVAKGAAAVHEGATVDDQSEERQPEREATDARPLVSVRCIHACAVPRIGLKPRYLTRDVIVVDGLLTCRPAPR
jgi:hypothetical protein